MIPIPSFSLSNTIDQYNISNDNPISFPIIVNIPSLCCMASYFSCPNFSSPMMKNLNNQNCSIPINYFLANHLVLFDVSQQYENNFIGKTALNTNSNLATSSSESNEDKEIKNIDSINISNSESTFNSSKRSARVHFTQKEDEKIKELVERFGKKNWSLIASSMNGRTAKQCRDRYYNYLVPGFFQGEWSKEEDDLLLKLYQEIGSKWSILQSYFPNRSSNSIKNRWHYFLRRKYEFGEKNKRKNEEENKKETIENKEGSEIRNKLETRVEINYIEDESNEEEEDSETDFDSIFEEFEDKPKKSEDIFEIENNVLDNVNENRWSLFD